MKDRGHAIVIGASIAGLLAGRVLADHFERVTVLDRDALPDGPEPRKGAPQSHHVHVLLRRGLLILERLFPQLEADLDRAGAPTVDWTRDMVTFGPAGWMPRFSSEHKTRTCSRGLLEYLIRGYVGAVKNITIRPRAEATGLVMDGGRNRVTGISVRDRDRSGDAPETLAGDLIVDASGRASRGLDWLSSLGYAKPEETVVPAEIAYVTRVYRRPAGFSADWKAMMVRSRPPFGLRGGLIYPIEKDLWLVNLAGAGEERPPADDGAFLDFAKSLIHPALHDAIKGAEPVAPAHAYQITGNRLRHFELLARWPERFAMLGDAACAFNPVYGQGMSVAALDALALGGWLDTSETALQFQQRLAKVVHGPWLLATNEDIRLAEGAGATPSRLDRVFQDYADQVVWLCATDAFALDTFMAVTHLMRPASALLHPRIALNVLGRILRRDRPNGKPTDPIPASSR